MRAKRSVTFSFVFLILSLLAAGCGATPALPPTILPTESHLSPTATVEPATPTVTTTSSPAPPIATETATLPPVPDTQQKCKLSPIAFTNVGFGFPKPPNTLPSLGTVKTIVLFADFEDVPAAQSPEELFAMVSPGAETFYRDISYGKMDYVLEPYFTWLRLSRPSSYYGQAIGSYEGHLQFIQEAVGLADPDVDFSVADSVLVIVPPEASQVPYGPAFMGFDGEGYAADGKIFSTGVTSGADLSNWGFLWLNHETGHSMTLPDLYLYSSSNPFRYVGDFGLMGNIAGFAPEYFAFERWQLGWVDDNQIFCQLDGDQVTTLTAVEITGGIKAVIIPVGTSRVVVIESRKRLGYDTGLVKDGALVYSVDTAIKSGEGTLVINPAEPNLEQAPLAVGESVSVAGVTITVLEATSESDTVQVSLNR
jgi:M6 family metalloprotease-like protein